MFSFLLLLGLAARAVADIDRYLDTTAYDNGAYGTYPTKSYISSDFVSPHLNILQDHPSCDDGSYTMISIRGGQVRDAAPIMMDHRGNLIWTNNNYKQNYGLDVQEYRGKKYLTFWAGNDGVKGHGSGVYYMLDENYKEAYKVEAGNGLEGDLHEFRITPQGTVLITVYQVVEADLASLGKSHKGYIWDGIIQEIDLETREVLFQWRSSEHYQVSDTERNIGGDGTYFSPFDYFHINSVDKDDKGNYLISSRFMWSLTYINGTSGEIIWILGGKRNNWKDLSGGQATNISYQHHARWHNDYKTITVFDNGADDGNFPEPYTRGMEIELNQETMEAKVLHTYVNPEHVLSHSQGSLQVLPNGNVLMGYGINSVFTEYDRNGTLLCNSHFGAASKYNTGSVQSYRVLKGNWTGYPTWPPDLELADDSAYVSWNGATEVDKWEVQRAETSDAKDEDFSAVSSSPWKTFETRITLTEDEQKPYVRIAGIDKNGNILGYTRVLQANVATVETVKHYPLYDTDFVPLVILIVFCGSVALGLCIWGLVAVVQRWRGGYSSLPKMEGRGDADPEVEQAQWAQWGEMKPKEWSSPNMMPRWAEGWKGMNSINASQALEKLRNLTQWRRS